MYDRKADYDWFQLKRDDIIKGHANNERVVIQDKQVIGYFKSDKEAIDAMKAKGFDLGTYIVQRCRTEEADTEYYFTNRYALA